MPAIAAAPLFYGAVASGAAAVGSGVIAARAQNSASRRAVESSERGMNRAESFEREQDAQNRADQARQDQEEQRRWEIQQANEQRKQEQEDAILRDNLQRQQYDDEVKYGKMLRLAELTGQRAPRKPPTRTAASLFEPTAGSSTFRMESEPLTARPSQVSSMIPKAGEQFDPFDTGAAGLPQRMPLRSLTARRY